MGIKSSLISNHPPSRSDFCLYFSLSSTYLWEEMPVSIVGIPSVLRRTDGWIDEQILELYFSAHSVVWAGQDHGSGHLRSFCSSAEEQLMWKQGIQRFFRTIPIYSATRTSICLSGRSLVTSVPFSFFLSHSQGSLFPLSHPPCEGGQLCHCCQCGEHGLRSTGSQTEQRHQRHRRGHECQPATTQVPVHIWRSDLASAHKV